jgi:hypothetical protein
LDPFPRKWESRAMLTLSPDCAHSGECDVVPFGMPAGSADGPSAAMTARFDCRREPFDSNSVGKAYPKAGEGVATWEGINKQTSIAWSFSMDLGPRSGRGWGKDEADSLQRSANSRQQIPES